MSSASILVPGEARAIDASRTARLTLPPDVTSTPSSGPLERPAICVHVNYSDLFWVIWSRVEPVAHEFDIFVTVTDNVPGATVREWRQALPLVEFVQVPNWGRDMRPLILLTNEGAFDSSSMLFRLHTKRSPHLRIGSEWFLGALDALVGSPERVREVRTALAGGVPMVAPRGPFPNVCVVTSHPLVVKLIDESGLGKGIPVTRFPVGGFFAVNRPWLQTLRSVGVRADAFEREVGQLDLTLAHALERFFGVIASHVSLEFNALAPE